MHYTCIWGLVVLFCFDHFCIESVISSPCLKYHYITTIFILRIYLNFFIKLLIFHFKTAPDMFSERSSPFCFPFCLTANPSLRLLALGNRPEDQRGSGKKDDSLTQEFKKFEPQEKSRHIMKEDSKMLEWYYKYKDSTILFLWLLYINRYFFSIEKIHNYYLHKYCREYFYYTI